ncbi:MAG: S1/P1 nuclease [Betaproteobacteria bacterium]
MHSSLLRCRAFIALAAFLGFSFLPATAWAWGNEGHRVTGLVANELLTPKARIRLNQLVPGINLGEFASQMDVLRAALTIELPGSDKWHYDNPPICGNRSYADYCPDGNCASSKIPANFAILADTTATTEARARAAMFLVHMVGDIHQPLHSSDDMDAGGNFKNTMPPNSDMPHNLHRVWDSDLPKLALRGVSESDFAKQLVARYKLKEIPEWQKGDVRDWVSESLALSRRVVYGNLPEYTCGVPWPKEKVVPLPQSYMDAGQEVIPMQLAKAGARIAWMLNRALENGPDPAAAKTTEYARVNKGNISAYVMLIRLRHDLYGKWKATGKWPEDVEANKALTAHSVYWQEQLKAGRALFSGGMNGDYWDNMALIVFEAGSQEEADAIVAADPAVKAFVFQAQARPFDIRFISNKYMTGDKKP